MMISANTSPFAGKEGKFVTSRNLRDRLEKELLYNVSIKIDFSAGDSFKVMGRGELQLAILIEMMRREDYEMSRSACPRPSQKRLTVKSMSRWSFLQ